MKGKIKIVHEFYGEIGSIITIDPESTLVLKMNPPTNSISRTRLKEAIDILKSCVDGMTNNYLIVGSDVEVSQLPIEVATELKLKNM